MPKELRNLRLEQLIDRVNLIKTELVALLQSDEPNFSLIQEKADTLNQLLTMEHPELSANKAYIDWLQETEQWLAEVISYLIIARNEVAYELVKLSQRKKADKYYGEHT